MKMRPPRVFVMAVMLICLAMPCICFGGQSGTSGLTTPIFVDVSAHDGKLTIAVNKSLHTEEQLGEFLQQVKEQFGDSDPVYIQFSGDISLDQIFELRDLVKKTHHDFHLVVTDGKSQKEIHLSDFNLYVSPPIPVPLPKPPLIPPIALRTPPSIVLPFGDFMTEHERQIRGGE